MASDADGNAGKIPRDALNANGLERFFAAASVALLVAALIAITKGQAEWKLVPFAIWLHLLLIIMALTLTPIMFLRRRGDVLHRQLGWIWAGSMFLTAVVTFFIQYANPGKFSFIHLLSVWTVIQVPRIIWHARHHNIAGHRSAVRGMVAGALLIAGFFTFPFNRMMGQWLFS